MCVRHDSLCDFCGRDNVTTEGLYDGEIEVMAWCAECKEENDRKALKTITFAEMVAWRDLWGCAVQQACSDDRLEDMVWAEQQYEKYETWLTVFKL